MESDQRVWSISDFLDLVPGSAENMKLCLEGNKTLERGATMEEVSEAIKKIRQGKGPGPGCTSDKSLNVLKMSRNMSFLERLNSTFYFLMKRWKIVLLWRFYLLLIMTRFSQALSQTQFLLQTDSQSWHESWLSPKGPEAISANSRNTAQTLLVLKTRQWIQEDFVSWGKLFGKIWCRWALVFKKFLHRLCNLLCKNLFLWWNISSALQRSNIY